MHTDRLSDEAIRLRLLRLALLHGGSVPLKDLSPGIDATTRRRLEERNLIERECFVTNARGRSVRCLTLTDTGWRWLAENFAGDVSRSSQCGRELAVILRMLQRLLARQDLTFGEAVAEHAKALEAPDVSAQPAEEDARERILEAHRAIAKMTGLDRVRLAELRERLADMPRGAFDATLRELEASGEAVLFRLDNPLEVRDADERAAFVTATGQHRHVVYLKGVS